MTCPQEKSSHMTVVSRMSSSSSGNFSCDLEELVAWIISHLDPALAHLLGTVGHTCQDL